MPVRTLTNKSTALRVLLVDDNSAGLGARCMVLEELGYDTLGVTCPLEALATFRKQPFDLVVTDYKMPHMTGRELIAELRKIEPLLPIILISGYAEPLGLTEKNTGATVVIMKSANEVQHLVRAVKRVLTLKVQRKPSASEAPKARRKTAAS